MFAAIFWLATTALLAQSIVKKPAIDRLVNDFTNTLTTSQKESLEDKLVDFNNRTSNEIAVVIIPSTNGQAISSYAFELGETWGIGNAKFDNGVVLLIAKNDRNLFLATGYGVEEYIPDIYANQVVDLVITPHFKQGNFYKGIDQGTDEIINLLQGTFEPRKQNKTRINPVLVFIIIFLIVFLIVLFNDSSSSGGTTVSRRGTTYYPRRTSWGGSSGGSSWGGGFGGSGGGGFSGGGGGFGGFGGGSFGGGGAGGSW